MLISLSPTQSRLIKGIAILMMVYLHLFNHIENVELCRCLFSDDGGIPLIHWLTRAANPVPFYLFLSGYGLFFSYRNGKSRNPWSRCWNLYLIYWLSLVFMLTIGHLVTPVNYPGSFHKLFENSIGWKTSYNAEAWFLFPYIILVLTSKYIFKALESLGNRKTSVICYLLYIFAAFIISHASRSGNVWLFGTMWLYQPILYLECLCPFLFGAIACRISKHSLPIWLDVLTNKNYKTTIIIVLLVLTRCIINTDALNPIYATLVIFLLSRLTWYNCLERALLFFGEYSTVMWLTHSYFCYYLFHGFIYSLRFPLLIFAVTVICSILISIPIKLVYNLIPKKFK